ncbi:fucose permease [Bifidobacterium margollesii]|uniref:Fucose permease n=1 Tax=Bifidobacterium margollesii TaxID=2020964 RepID=A0A2N5J8R3_9BIFI|nr:MFS transporter [Bifidobacterium margollesii]PLS30599.1 fucose permease [Bifidobacterium margollesii]
MTQQARSPHAANRIATGNATPPNYDRTVVACFNGYVTQAVVNNFLPLLFVTLSTSLHMSLTELSGLITVNFITQLIVDVLAGKYVDRIGYKRCIVAAHVCAAVGLVSLGILPQHVADPYAALLTSIFLYAIGGGLIEVMVSPIVEACPTRHKAQAMSLLHSFYCWGQLATVGVSTLFFAVFGIDAWPYLACLWALIPLAGIVMFAKAPMPEIIPEGVEHMRTGTLLRKPLFYLLFVMMLCAGAAEQGMAQWASAFAETGLGVSKTIGDLAGPAAFALTMALSRTLYGIIGRKINLRICIAGSAVLCVAMYLLAALSPMPILGLLGCAFTGFTVGIMWPGTFSLAAERMPGGGTLMFALFAVAGDLGCSAGPAVVGLVASANNGNLHSGLLAGTLFAVGLLICTALLGRSRKVARS